MGRTVLAVFSGLVLGVFAAFSLAVYQAGFLVVEVRSSGAHLSFPIPLAAVEAALWLIPGTELEEIQRRLGPHRNLLPRVLKLLEDCPDATFLEFRDGGTWLSVSKTGKRLVVIVSTPEEQVLARIPLSGTRYLLRRLAAGSWPG